MIIWKKYNMFYEVSNAGELRSIMFDKVRILKGLVKPDGYKMYYLKHEDSRSRWKYIHRLVAELFIVNPDSLPEVNHKDRDKLNNSVINLEWITHADNCQHSFDNGRKIYLGAENWNTGKLASEETRNKMSEKKIGEKHPKFKGYYIIDGNKYTSLTQASQATGLSRLHVRRFLVLA